MGRPSIKTPLAVKTAAIGNYKAGLLLEVIAEKYSFTPATISNWAEEAGLPRRPRGIRRPVTPSDRDRLIIRRAREIPINAVAREFRMTRARVWSIRTNWKKAGWVEPMPWNVGDTITWAGELLKVVRIDDEKRGAVKTANGITLDPFKWKFNGRTARMLMRS